MTEQTVFVGITDGGKWRFNTQPVEISLEQAVGEVAAHFDCTPEDAKDSLLKHKYASAVNHSSNRHWHLKSESVQGVVDSGGVTGDRW